MTPQRIEEAERIEALLRRLSNSIELDATERNRAAGACFAIVQDHFQALLFLLKHKFNSSAFALLRCFFDAYLRGLWIKHCASDMQVRDFFNGTEPPKTMVEEIEDKPTFATNVLSCIKRQHWSKMCEFTHTGGLHLKMWQSFDGIEPHFPDEELEWCLNSSELYASVAALELKKLSRGGDDGKIILDLMNQRWPR